MRGLVRVLFIAFAWSGESAAEIPAGAPRSTHGLDFVWQAPRTCPSENEVVAQLERLLGASVPRTDGAARDRIHVRARIDEASGRFSLVLDVRDGSAERRRELVAPTCHELVNVTALVIALVLNPELDIAEREGDGATARGGAGVQAALALLACPEAPPARAPERPSSTVPVCLPAPERPAEAAAASPSSFWVGAGVAVAHGLLPRVLPRPLLGAAYAAGSRRVDLTASFGSATYSEQNRGRGAAFELWAAAPRLCQRAVSAAIDVSACLGAEIGVLRAEGFGVQRTHVRRSFWLAPSVGALLDWKLTGESALLLTLEGLVPITRTSFEIAGDRVHRSDRVVPAARLAGLLALP